MMLRLLLLLGCMYAAAEQLHGGKRGALPQVVKSLERAAGAITGLERHLEQHHTRPVDLLQTEEKEDGLPETPLDVSRGSPCAPTLEVEAKEHIRGSQTWIQAGDFEPNPDKVKFFLHNQGAFNFSDVVQCYFEVVGPKDELDLYALPVDAEHSTDVRLIHRMSIHPARTLDPAEATIHVIGAPLNTAFLAYNLVGHPCGTGTDLRQRESQMAAALRQLEAWKTSPEKFVWIDTDWRVARALGPELMEMMNGGKSVLASADNVIAHEFGKTNRSVVIPYHVHFMLDRAAVAFANRAQQGNVLNFRYMELVDGTADMNAIVQRRRAERPISFHSPSANLDETRDISFTFNGKINRTGEGHMRDTLDELIRGIQNTSVKDVDFKKYSIDQFSAISVATANTMLQSLFCLVPAGDTPSSRRLFDALAAGCVPVILEDFPYMARNLPFRNTVRWKDIAIFAGGLECAANNVQTMNAWLKSLLEESPKMVWQVERMRSLGRTVFAKFMSYKSPQVVQAFLGEFNDQGLMKLPSLVASSAR